MIENLIGSGILVAVGAGLTWAVMRERMTVATSREEHNGTVARFWAHHYRDMRAKWEANFDKNIEYLATISRLSDTVGQLQYKRDKTLEYCKQFRVRGAVVAGILSGEQDQ
ncbi:MAG: hypothetical protein EON59_12995 [Alphaproteobacteria bacterium]|nr:MAG: hypothetical protein EON59_12995 [Alphaproteobacteria bacterium]